jgi:hypothetical protein
MAELIAAFNERLEEVEAYLDMLRILEQEAQSGPPRFYGADQPITVQQQKILYSSVYLQLYNLVESTMTRCVDAIAQAATINPRWQAGDLSLELRKEWVRFTARTHHRELTPKNRLDHALELCQHLVSELPISSFSIEKSGGGNWDDDAIEKISKRLGLNLQVSQPVKSNIKRRLKDDLGPLGLVKKFRNQLAHGSISFSECAEEDTVAWLVDIKDKTASYLREVVAHFDSYIETHKYLVPESRPA